MFWRIFRLFVLTGLLYIFGRVFPNIYSLGTSLYFGISGLYGMWHIVEECWLGRLRRDHQKIKDP